MEVLLLTDTETEMVGAWSRSDIPSLTGEARRVGVKTGEGCLGHTLELGHEVASLRIEVHLGLVGSWPWGPPSSVS